MNDHVCHAPFYTRRSMRVKSLHTQPEQATLYLMSKTIAYTRTSTDDQANGLDVQRAEIAQWAAARGLVVETWFVDEGVSGTAPLDKRPALMAALGSLRRGDVLVIQKRDRLARDVTNAVLIEREVGRAKASLACAHGGDGKDPTSTLVRQVLDAVGQFEVEMIRARTKAALAAKSARGEALGEVPFGSRRDGIMLTADEVEAEVVHHVRALRSTGETLASIVSKLDALGCKSRAGKPLAITQVARILKRTAVAHAS